MYAKTLYKPERPKNINDKIAEFTKGNVPHFFIYAKDKETWQVENKNKSFVNKLDNIIINPRINCRGIGLKDIDYKVLVKNPDIKVNVSFSKNGKIDEKNTDPIIVKYCELNQKYHFKINMECADSIKGEILTNSQIKQDLFYKNISKEIKDELSVFGYSESEITDILVKFLYYIKPSKHKSVLWFCYGKNIVENLKNYYKIPTKTIQCCDCGEWFDVNIKDNKTQRCPKCYSEYRKEYYKYNKRKQRKAQNTCCNE